MSCKMRWEQCCEEEGCKRPARYGSLCTACLFAATPARRAVEMVAHSPETGDWDAALLAELMLGD